MSSASRAQLMINLKTGKMLGLTISPSVPMPTDLAALFEFKMPARSSIKYRIVRA